MTELETKPVGYIVYSCGYDGQVEARAIYSKLALEELKKQRDEDEEQSFMVIITGENLEVL